MTELDFDFTLFLEEEATPMTGAGTSDSIVSTAPICSESSIQSLITPSGGCLPGNESSVPQFPPKALPLPSILPSGGCLSGFDDSNLKAATSPITRGSAPFSSPDLGTFKSPEQVVQKNRGLYTIQGAGQLATALAHQSYFGVRTLIISHVKGKSGPALDGNKLLQLKEFSAKVCVLFTFRR